MKPNFRELVQQGGPPVTWRRMTLQSALRTHLSQAMRTVRKMEQQKLMLFSGYANLNRKDIRKYLRLKVSCIKDSKSNWVPHLSPPEW
jgi:hypothetical protein